MPQSAPDWDPVQTAPEWSLLEYKNSFTAKILNSRSLYSKGLLTGILYIRLQDVVFWDIEIPSRQRDSIFQKPIPQSAPYWGPVQTAPGWGLLEYRNSFTAEILYSRSLYPRVFLSGVLYKRLQDGVFWDIKGDRHAMEGGFLDLRFHCFSLTRKQFH